MMAVMAEAVATQTQFGIGDFGRWMATEQPRVYFLCLRMLRDSGEADNAAQDAFLKAYRALERGDGTALEDPSKWLTRIAVNTCLDRLRLRRWQFWRRRPSQEHEETMLALAPAVGPSPEDKLFARQIATRLSVALAKMPDRQRSVFVLKHYENRTLEEIAGLLGIEVGTVKAHMARALTRLRVELKDLYGRQTLDR